MIKDISRLMHQLELKTKKSLSGPLLSDFRSKQKGTGFEFHQLRDYQQGDDVRFIDWKSSAKLQKLVIREYLEDRNRIIFLAVDCSASEMYGSTDSLKWELIKTVGALLSFAALHAKDSVGLILFTDTVEVKINPSADRSHVLFLIETLLTYKPHGRKTDMFAPLKYIASLKQKNSVVYFLSDFSSFVEPSLLRALGRRHELLALRFADEREISFPHVGLLTIEDLETLRQVRVSTGEISAQLKAWRDEQTAMLKSSGIDSLDIVVGKPYMRDLIKFLQRRG